MSSKTPSSRRGRSCHCGRSGPVLAGFAPVQSPPLLPAEMHEKPPEVFRIFLYPMIKSFDFLLLQESEHMFLQLPGALAGDNLDQWRLFPHSLVDDVLQGAVDVLAPVVDVMQVEFQLHLALPGPALPPRLRRAV